MQLTVDDEYLLPLKLPHDLLNLLLGGYFVFAIVGAISGHKLFDQGMEGVGGDFCMWDYHVIELNQYLTCVLIKLINLFFNFFVDHHTRPAAIGASEAGGGAEQTTDQRPVIIDLATLIAQMWAVEFGKRRLMLLITFYWQHSHLFARCCHRATAVMTAGRAFK